MKIETKTIKKLNRSSGYIGMPLEKLGQEYVVLTMKELEFMLGRKLEE